MKKFICLSIISTLLFSCEKEKPSHQPFIVNHNITCNNLYDAGYKRIFGIDVVMVGKKVKDTTIYYQIEIPFIENEQFNYEIEEEIDEVRNIDKYEEYTNKDALTLTDSIYNLVWGSPKGQIHSINKEKGYVYWRNYNLRLKKSEVKTFRNSINKRLYKVFDVHSNTSHENELEYFKVINLIEKDTFDCYIIKDEDSGYYFSSQIKIKNEN